MPAAPEIADSLGRVMSPAYKRCKRKQCYRNRNKQSCRIAEPRGKCRDNKIYSGAVAHRRQRRVGRKQDNESGESTEQRGVGKNLEYSVAALLGRRMTVSLGVGDRRAAAACLA